MVLEQDPFSLMLKQEMRAFYSGGFVLEVNWRFTYPNANQEIIVREAIHKPHSNQVEEFSKESFNP
jgi:hypothetical protein